MFIANIVNDEASVNCFLFEINGGKQLPVKKGCYDEVPGDSPFRLNSFVMEKVRNGAEGLCEPAISGQNNNNNNNNNNDNKIETAHGLQRSDTRTKLHGTRLSDGKFVFDTSKSEVEKALTPSSEENQETKANNPAAESVHVGENHTKSVEVITEQPKSQSQPTVPPNNEISDTTNKSEKEQGQHEEEKALVPSSEENHETNANNPSAKFVDKEEKDTKSEEAITEQLKSQSQYTDRPNNEIGDTQHKSTTTTTTNESETGHGLQRSDTRTKLHGTRLSDGKFVFDTSSNEEGKAPTSPSEENQKTKANNPAAESVNQGGNDTKSEEVITEQPTFQSQPTVPPSEENQVVPPSEENQETKANNPVAEIVNQGGNDTKSEEAITEQPRFQSQPNVSPSEENQIVPPSEENQETKVNNPTGEEKSETKSEEIIPEQGKSPKNRHFVTNPLWSCCTC